MAIHHIALATRDAAATHRFYTEAMGFELVKVVVGKTPEGGWAKHLFYRTDDGGMIAFWELHDESLPDEWSPAISTGQGLPPWVNHIAFRAEGLEDLTARRQRWLDHGLDCTEVDHGWCHSVYTLDPNGTLVEFCTDTRELDDSDRREAEQLRADPNPALEPVADVLVHRARRAGAE
jgi:catechol 2,3-dioxygenase-like lactoylglutathione lyase family enzyme